MSKATTKLDAKGRVSIGKHTDQPTGTEFHIEKGEGGTLTLTPAEGQQE